VFPTAEDAAPVAPWLTGANVLFTEPKADETVDVVPFVAFAMLPLGALETGATEWATV
jgi:hypothetical protein